MSHVSEIVDRVADAMGASADPAQVEAVVTSLLETDTATSAFGGSCLHISLADCSSLLTTTVRARAYDKIRRIASHLESALDASGIGGFRRIAAWPPLTLVAGKAAGPDFVVLARMLEDAALDCSAAEIFGMTATAGRMPDGVSSSSIEVIPEVLQTTARVIVDVLAATPESGLDINSVKAAVAAARRFDGPSEALVRLRVTCGVSAPALPAEAAFVLTAEADRMIEAAMGAAPDAPIHEIAAVLAATAFGLGRMAAQRAEHAAAVVAERSGFAVRFGGIEVDPGPVSASEPPFAGSLAAAIASGFTAAVGESRILPGRMAVAFTTSTDTDAAAGNVARELVRSCGRAVALHPIFTGRRAGELLSVGPHVDVPVEEPRLEEWHRRGGRIPLVGSRRS